MGLVRRKRNCRRVRLLKSATLGLLSSLACAQTVSLPNPPQVRAKNHIISVQLHAVNHDGRDAFAFNGKTDPPVLRLSPGDTLKIDYVNDLPPKSSETCAVNPCMDMTNLHFHGLAVSPNAPQDDVLDMLAKPGEALHYAVKIPADHLPGLYWYHTHPHGESHRQVLDGMSGAIVIEGIDRYVPEVSRLRERVVIVRGLSIDNDPNAEALRQKVEIPSKGCGGNSATPDELMTVNGALRPNIAIAPGERQFWRIVNASADRYLDLQIDEQNFEIVALDGVPLAYHLPKNPTLISDHFLLSPAGRLEAIVTGPAENAHAALRTLCVNTGPVGDPNPAMILADLVARSDPSDSDNSSQQLRTADTRPPVYKPIHVDRLKQAAPNFTVLFTEDKDGFYINGRKFALDAPPMTTARVGTYQHWKIVNATAELHPFHIHQVHFLAYAENGAAVSHPEWLDTVNVPVAGSVDVILDMTDPVIKGMSLFHCHLLNHEDKGMMAKILFQ